MSLFSWLCYYLSKLNQTSVRKSPANEVVAGLLRFLIVWNLDTVNMVLLFFQFELKIAVYAALTEKKNCAVNNFFILMFLIESFPLASLT